MKLTALIPVYNDDYALSFCLPSIVHYFDEIVILDDASTDETPWICAYFTTRFKHVRYELNRGPQLGWVQARNRLAAMTDSEHLFWIDSDDVLCEYNAHMLQEIAGGGTPVVRLQLTEMWGDLYHTTGRLRHYDRCHIYLNRRKAPDFKWVGGAAAACAAPGVGVKNGPGPLFFHLKGVKPDRRLAERRVIRDYLRARLARNPDAEAAPERLCAFRGIEDWTDERIHQEALKHLLGSRIDRLVPTYRGNGTEGAPKRPAVIKAATDRFLIVYKDDVAVDRIDRGWEPGKEADAGQAAVHIPGHEAGPIDTETTPMKGHLKEG